MIKQKEIKQEWCEAWITHLFTKPVIEGKPVEGIRTGLFWELAEKAGLYEAGTYGSPMSKALEKLTIVETIKNEKGEYAYSVFKLKWAYAKTAR